MSQADRQSASRGITNHLGRGMREISLFLLLAVSLYLLFSLLSFDINDPGWSHQTEREQVANSGGPVGAWFSDLLYNLFGYLAYLFPLLVALGGWLIIRGRREETSFSGRIFSLRLLGFAIALVSGCALADIHFFAPQDVLPAGTGGILGHVIGDLLAGMFNQLGATLFLLALFLGGITLFTDLSWLRLSEELGRYTLRSLALLAGIPRRFAQWRESARESAEARAASKAEPEKPAKKPRQQWRKKKDQAEQSPAAEPELVLDTLPETAAKKAQIHERSAPELVLTSPPGGASLPEISLLEPAKPQEAGYSREKLEHLSRLLEEKLAEFGITVEVVAVQPGPVITRFELQPAPGVKVSQISNLSKDIARSLSMVSVRVVEVIPGKSVIGLEIPNEKREMIFLSEIFRSKAFVGSESELTLALGKDIAGNPVVANLAKMPHLLVAGTTGSGKSVGVNAMLLSMLYKATPEELRLILIDPKMLELSIYEGIPHLLTPVVTDMKEAANSLRWSVGEMERRYKLMAAMGVRNIAGYNKKIRQAIKNGDPIKDPFYDPGQAFDPEAPHPTLEPLPYIVVTIDEFADMIMVVGKKVEELIARLAQKARAAGIHLILATQRPSVDVITGLIKANVPTRVAFQVSSKVDSRTILDQMGAENLLGNGDMLYLPPGSGVPMRVHGAFVSDNEVHQVVDYLKSTGEPEYINDITEEQSEVALPGEKPVSPGTGEEMDELYDQAVAIVTESGKASISYVQRRLKIGYNRAARMIEEMEAQGVVGPLAANGSREVLAPPPPKD